MTDTAWAALCDRPLWQAGDAVIRVFHDAAVSDSAVTVVGLWQRGWPVTVAHVKVPHRLGLLEYIPWWSYRQRLQRAVRQIRRTARQMGGVDA